MSKDIYIIIYISVIDNNNYFVFGGIMSGKLKVMLSTEGTYPFHQGGVSTWCHMLVQNISQVDYFIYSIIMNPFVTQKFTLPDNTGLIKVPLWGTEEPSEHLTTPFSQVYIAKRQTADSVVKEHFIPLFTGLIEQIMNPAKDSKQFGNVILELHKYFQEYDYRKSFKSEITWNVFKDYIINFTNEEKNQLSEPCVFSMSQSLGWLYRFLNILNTPIPKVNVTHSAAAAFCGIPCVVAKLNNKTPFLLTEHGVYLREQYLSLAKRGYPSYLNSFLIKLINSVVDLNYQYADQVSPVCDFNTRWEREFGVNPNAIKVIYNGVNKDIYKPKRDFKKNKYPTVVTVARVDPVKDIITLIQSAEIVKERIPEVRFILYGSVTVQDYYEECMTLVNNLDLSETFIFAGHTDDVAAAYRSGDVIALSSITEAFPYSVVEAMMTGKAIVSTDVGGIKEALGDTGVLVEPRQPRQMAESLISLLENVDLRLSMGEDARERALNYFTIEKVLDIYLQSYKHLAADLDEYKVIAIRVQKQRLMAEKGYALQTLGYWQAAVEQFRQAIKQAPDSPAVPVILTEIAKAYNHMGDYDRAFSELEKAEVFMQLMNLREIA